MRRALLALVSTAAGLAALLSFKTHSVSVAAPTSVSSTTGPGTTSAAGDTPTTSTPSTGATPTTSGASADSTGDTSSSASTASKTVTGDSIDTRWGPVQVKITVAAGKLTAATAIVYPSGNGRDQEINSYAIPQLTKEALAAGNAKIDMVSGATYTSTGYINSLQSALDKAGL